MVWAIMPASLSLCCQETGVSSQRNRMLDPGTVMWDSGMVTAIGHMLAPKNVVLLLLYQLIICICYRGVAK